MRAVSTEWHVHLVREAEAQHQFRRDSLAGKCQLCVQCPNGRKHSSLFAIHLLPHWLRGSRGADDPPQDSPMACTGIKTAAMAIDKLSDPNPTQRCLMSACLSDWLTGEVYPDAVVFSTHPNGHLLGDKQTAMLHMPICMCMKALMKIKRPLDPRNPTEQLPLHKLSTLKLTLSVKFTRGGIHWEQDFISPGVIKLVSRVTDRALEDAETSAPKVTRGKRDEELAKHEEELAASILLGRPAPSSVARLTRFSAPLASVPPHSTSAATPTLHQELRRDAHKYSETFLRAFTHNPEATLSALEKILRDPANTHRAPARKRSLVQAGSASSAPSASGPSPPPCHEGAWTRRCSATGESRASEVIAGGREDDRVHFELVSDDATSATMANA